MASVGALRVEPSTEDDLPRLMELVLPEFEDIPFSQLVGDTNTPSNRVAAAGRHHHTWREHAKHSIIPFAIKCIHTNADSGAETIISNAEWAIYDRVRTQQEYTTPVYLLSADWVADGAMRRQAQEFIRPVVDARVRWMGGKPHGVLLFMVTDDSFRRLGAATLCIQWGLDHCAKLKCPAMLEATEMGVPVYEQLGFEIMERIKVQNRSLPIMIWWPPGTRDEDKRQALPGYGQ